MLIERYLGVFKLGGALLINSLVSALTTTIYQRKIGYREVRKRGRMANHNGNVTLFLVSFFSFIHPNYLLYSSKFQVANIYFWYILVIYGVMYFTNQYNFQKNKAVIMQNSNETHYSGFLTGAILGTLFKRHLFRGMIR